MHHDHHKERENTFRPEDFFKVVCLAPTKDIAEEKAKWLTNTPQLKSNPFCCYRAPFKDSEVIIYSSWPNDDEDQTRATVGIDALVIFIDKEEDYDRILKEINQEFKFITVRLLVTDFEGKRRWEKDLEAESIRTSSSAEEVLHQLDHLDKDEYKKILKIIDKFDANKDGTLDLQEMPALVKALGEDPNKSEIKEAMKTLDINHDNELQIDEFIQWWKIGRQNTPALAKIYELAMKSNEIINNLISFNNFDKERQAFDANNNKQCALKFNLNTGNFDEYVTRLGFRISTGEKRLEATKNFLSKFTNIHDAKDDNWINISIFVQSLTFKGEQIKEWLENFRHNLIGYCDKYVIPGLGQFIRHFVNFHFFPQDYSATITFEFKTDVYSLIKGALGELLSIRDFLTNDGKGSFDVDLRILSGECLGDLISQSKTWGDFLNKSEISINGTSLKGRLRTLLLNLNKDHKTHLDLLQFLFVPNNMKFDFKGPLAEFLNENSKGLLNTSLEPLQKLLEFIRKNIKYELLECMSRLEIGLNLYDIFFNFQIFSEHLWHGEEGEDEVYEIEKEEEVGTESKDGHDHDHGKKKKKKKKHDHDH
jgi:Ca2+-binding EF-hand superfamily protein